MEFINIWLNEWLTAYLQRSSTCRVASERTFVISMGRKPSPSSTGIGMVRRWRRIFILRLFNVQHVHQPYNIDNNTNAAGASHDTFLSVTFVKNFWVVALCVPMRRKRRKSSNGIFVCHMENFVIQFENFRAHSHIKNPNVTSCLTVFSILSSTHFLRKFR